MKKKKKEYFKVKHKRHRKSKAPADIREHIFKFLKNNPGLSFSARQINKNLGVKDQKGKVIVGGLLTNMVNNGLIGETQDHHYFSLEEPEYITGRVDYVNPRHGFVISEASEEDIWIKARDMNYALDGDLVKVALKDSLRKGKRPEGRVVEVLERKRDTFAGKVEISTRFAFVVPDFKKMYYDIFVPLEGLAGAQHNDKVVVQITQWPDKDRKPEGKITRILGKSGDNEAEIHSIMAEFDLPFSFPGNVEKAAKRIKEDIEGELPNRRDMRAITTFTIDPEDAKDFDDALSVEKLENGNYEIGVHIADVSHYVKPGTLLDQEAIERATSVYLVDRTIPMLPERLSNQLCSLRPQEEKLTFSAVFEMDEHGEVVNQWFGRTVIYSDRRFTYEDAQKVIESGEGDYKEELQVLHGFSKKLKERRFKNGSINFESVEVKFKLDEKGKPIGVVPKVRKDAHFLIEEFMLLANKHVAEFIFKMKKEEPRNTFVYRVHENPDPEKLQSFSIFARRFGHALQLKDDSISHTLNRLFDEIEGKPEQNVLETLAVRSMAKARYTTESTGHFGLAFSHYTHFTSPIRRYPDVMVHRLLQHYLDKKRSVKKNPYEEKCIHSSEREKRAADAERASIKYKQVEFMQNAEDKDYEGLVTGVTDWGIFVEMIETKCEGMVRMVDMTDDYYEFDEKNYCVVGRSNKKMITLGDKVKVRVKATDIDRRTIDLEFSDMPASRRHR
ncbi:ribonuclease R [Xanthovirga aplysinae]|uniref:ribonuclease R n=1 Tax=Xanthovirga aplysinae TaxID=2529853 RepID=UPI0012BB4C1D|nr:ribonuclease R [Xanthovirga aplysinae]MTI31383.1 ribonuclease R [Xanthovirga aplysinae]